MTDSRYSIKELADLSGVSIRTLHHYDQRGLLTPAREPNGYRSYGPAEVRRLQQILLYRACGVSLSQIAEILDSPHADESSVLTDQLARLRKRRLELEATIRIAERTLSALQKGEDMTDTARFEGLKRATIEENERRHGTQARAAYGDNAVDAANEALLSMDEETWNDMNALEGRIKELLSGAMATGDTTSHEAQELVRAHARWLSLHWGAGTYTPEAHRGLAEGYLADERFIAYYDGACGTGATQFLHDAIIALA